VGDDAGPVSDDLVQGDLGIGRRRETFAMSKLVRPVCDWKRAVTVDGIDQTGTVESRETGGQRMDGLRWMSVEQIRKQQL